MAISLGVSAQKYDNVSKYLIFNPAQGLNAKAEIDKIATEKPKALDKAEFWLWKARAYSSVFNDSTLRATNAGAINTAWEAFSKYISMDPEMKVLKDDAGTPGLGSTIVDQIYGNCINIGFEHFKKEQWSEAYELFLYGYKMGEFITQKDLRNNKQAYDTLSVTFVGYAAQNANKVDEALKYYKILADSKVKEEKYLPTYKYILISSSNKKDSASFYKYYAIAKEVFPKQTWDEFETDFINKSYNLDQKLSYYQRHDAANDMSAMQYFGLGDDFTSPSAEEKKTIDSAKLEAAKLVGIDAYKKAFTKDNKQGIAAYNVGVLVYSKFDKLDDKLRENLRTLQNINAKKTEIKDPAKKKAYELKVRDNVEAIKTSNAVIDVDMMKLSDDGMEWLEKAFNQLKDQPKRSKQETNCLNQSVKLLYNLNEYRRNKVKAKDPKAYDAFDAKCKFYDALQDKY